jgi:hypothetical protein
MSSCFLLKRFSIKIKEAFKKYLVSIIKLGSKVMGVIIVL